MELPIGTSSPSVPIAFIGGWGRSGSTLLSRMLGEVDGYVNVGEVRDVFLRGLAENRVCGCGARFQECEFWSTVGEDAYGGWSNLDPQHLAELRNRTDKPWHVPALLKQGLRSDTDAAVEEYGSILLPLYRAILKASGASVVVDSSKIASFGAILKRTPGLSPRFIHLVRDPRGTLNSWMKEVRMVDDPDTTRYMPRYSIFDGTARYVGYNLEMHAVARGSARRLLRYEDLVTDPEKELRQALSTVAINAAADLSDIVGAKGANLGMSHTVIGNPMRHQRGWIPLRQDDAWRTALPPVKRRMITALTLPALAAYHYDARV